MNCAYRLIWNEDLNAWVVAPEIASARGKRGQVKRSAAALMLTLAIGAHAALAADLATTALPGGGQVSAGQATISSTGAAMTINQGSQRAIINWQNFDIGSQASVNFQQPNSAAVTLNRAGGPTASRIEGQLTANGQVFLINPSGVLFGSGARVNVGGLVASTLNIRDDDFLSGNYVFSGNSGSIANQGQITAAPGGYLAFIAPTITNNGTISAPQGTVAMGAGERVRLNFAGDRLVGLDVSASTIDTLITNNQAIRAEGGAILLTAAGAEAVTRGVINNTGVLEASSLASDGGRIVLTAGNDINLGSGSTVAVDGQKGGEITVQAQSGTLLADGQLTARGASGAGGTVKLLGHQVGLVNAAQVDASGATGGGTVLVGGDYQGRNADVQNAFRTYVGPQVTIKANALQQGDGGKVVVWADDATRFYGSISAKGGSQSGNGGFVEVSGKGYLDFNGLVDTSASAGSTGTLLLDPTDITISTGVNTIESSGSTIFQETTPTATSVLNTTTLQTALASNNVLVTTASPAASAGNITVSNPVTWSSANTLTLTANNNIAINAAITTGTAPSALILNATGNVTQSGTGIIGGAGGLTKNGAGTATLSLANTYTGATTINAGTLALGAADRIADASAVTVASGATFNLGNFAETIGSLAGTGTVTKTGNTARTLTVGGNNASTIFSGLIQNTGTGALSITKNGTGTFTLSGANTYTGTTTVSAGMLVASSNTALGTTAGGVTVSSGATLALQGGITVGAETLSLNGTGVGGNGALRNLGGNNAWGGTITLAGTTEIQSDAGTLLLNAANSITGTNRALTIDGAGNTTIGGTITTGTGTLTKNGAGTLTLSGANTYTGTTTINAGALRYGVNNAVNTGAVVVNDGGTYDLNGFSDTIGALTVNSGTVGGTVTTGSGTLTLGGNVTSTGGAANASISGNLALGANRTFTTTNAADGLNVSALISGGFTLTKAGTGTLTLSAANTYTSNTTISAGTLVAANAAALGAAGGTNTVTSGATLNINNVSITGENISIAGTGVGAAGALTGSGTAAWGGSVTMTAASTIGTAAATDTLALNGVVSGAFALTKVGVGTLTLSGNNTYTGATNLNAGTLVAANNGALGNAAGSTTVTSGATLALQGGITIADALTLNGTGVGGGGALRNFSGNNTASGAVTLGAGGARINSDAGLLTVSGAIGGATQPLTVGGAGNTTLSGVIGTTTGTLTKDGAGTLTLSGNNTYTGATNINAGTLALNAANRIADTSAVTVASGATFNLAGFAETVGSIAGAGNITLGAGALTAGGNNTSTSFSGVISGTGNLAKAGTGALTLSGANTYSGNTTVSAGTLVAANAAALGAAGGTNTVTSGATLNINNVSITGENISIAGTGVGAAGALTGSGTAAWGGSVTMTAASTIGTAAATDTLALNGVVSAGGFSTTISGLGSVTATNASNDFATVNINNARNVSLRDANAIALGGGASTLTGNLVVQAAGNVTVANTITATGGDITLAGTNFVNNVGASALSASGRWLVYANTVTGNTFNGLLSGNQAIWGTSYPAAVSQTGNRYVFSISPSLTVTSDNRSKIYGQDGAPIVAGAYTATGFINAATYGNVFTQDTQVNTVTGNAISAGSATTANVGSYAIDVTPVTATTGYTLTKSNTGNLTVNPAPLTITGNTTSSLYTSNLQTNTFTTSGLLGSDTVTSVATLASGTNVGTYADNLTSATGTGLGNYTIGYVNGSLTITPAPLTITGNTTSSLYTAAAQTNTFSTAGLLGSDSVTSVATLASGTNVGTYADNLTSATGTGLGNYTIGYVNGSLTITPAPLTITGGTTSSLYTAAAQTNTFSTAGLLGSDSVTSVATLASGTNVGTYADNLTSATGTGLGNYTIGYVNGSLTITPAPLTITGGTTSSLYTAAAQTNTFSTAGLLGSDSVTSVATLASGTNVGTYADNLTSATGTGLTNYTIGYVNGSLSITPAPLTITGNTTSNVYTAAAQTNGYTTSGLLTGNGDSVTSVATLGSGTNVGTYADNLTSATGTGLTNYTIGYVNGSLTITPAPLTITGNTTSNVYTAAAQTNGYTTSGLLTGNGDSVTSVATLASGTNVGTYADNLTSATGTGLTNYTIGYVNGSLTITPAPLTITANDASRPVNTSNPQFSATYTGFVGGETPAALNGVLAFATPATLTSPVGVYSITPYGQSSGNYTITYLDGDLTVYGAPVITPTLPREVVSQQAIGAQYTDPTMPSDTLTGLQFIFDDKYDAEDEKAETSVVRVVGSGIRLPN